MKKTYLLPLFVIALSAGLFILPYWNHPGFPGDLPAGGHDTNAAQEFAAVISNKNEAPVIALIILIGLIFPALFSFEWTALHGKKVSQYMRDALAAQFLVGSFVWFALLIHVFLGIRFMTMPGDGSFPSNIPLLAAYVHMLLLSVTLIANAKLVVTSKKPHARHRTRA